MSFKKISSTYYSTWLNINSSTFVDDQFSPNFITHGQQSLSFVPFYGSELSSLDVISLHGRLIDKLPWCNHIDCLGHKRELDAKWKTIKLGTYKTLCPYFSNSLKTPPLFRSSLARLTSFANCSNNHQPLQRIHLMSLALELSHIILTLPLTHLINSRILTLNLLIVWQLFNFFFSLCFLF